MPWGNGTGLEPEAQAEREAMSKYKVEIPNNVVECDSFHDVVLVAKQNQPSIILRGTWVITRFPWAVSK